MLAAYRDGDQAAFAALYHRYRGPLYRYLLRQLPVPAAEDAYQELWIKFLNNLSGYREQGKLQAYLFRIARNLVMDELRRRAPLAVVTSADDVIAAQPADARHDVQVLAEQQELHAALMVELGKLPVNQRDVWLMKQESSLSVAEIAQLTNSSVEGVKSRLRYATAKLTAGLKRYVRS